MKKPTDPFLTVVLSLSVTSTLVGIVSISTPEWATSGAGSNIENFTVDGRGGYGLFDGTWQLELDGDRQTFDVKITCIVAENICAWSYRTTSEERSEEIESLYDNCMDDDCDRKFLNAGLWISTIFFVSVAALLSVLTVGVSTLCVFTNPMNDYLNVFGLKILNASSSAGYAMVLITWGVQFATRIGDNFGVYETLKGNLTSRGLASLGYSYWILTVPILLHSGNVGVLYYRQLRLARQPTASAAEPDSKTDGAIFLY